MEVKAEYTTEIIERPLVNTITLVFEGITLPLPELQLDEAMQAELHARLQKRIDEVNEQLKHIWSHRG